MLSFVDETNRKDDFMQAIKAVYDGFTFTPTEPVPIQGQYEVVITFIEPIINRELKKIAHQKRQLGFLKDEIPPLPDSFFEPLPEDDLQAWGL